jgi:hypothetical protein
MKSEGLVKSEGCEGLIPIFNPFDFKSENVFILSDHFQNKFKIEHNPSHPSQ